MNRRERRAMRAAGFTPDEQRDFISAWNSDAGELDCYQARLIMRFYFAAAEDPDDVVSLGMLATTAQHVSQLEAS